MKIKDTEKSRVLSTTEYGLFNYEKERIFRKKIDMLKIAMIEKNISKDVPIIVNAEFKILDGRHRFIANVELKAPIYFKVAEVANFVDLLKATTLIRKPTHYDFLLAHKDKLFYRKAIEHVKLLPYSIDDIFYVIYGIKLNKNSNEYKQFVNGETQFNKEFDFKVQQIDELVTGLYDTYDYYHNELMDLECFLTFHMYSGKATLEYISKVQGIQGYSDLYKRGHPDLEGIIDYVKEVEDFETSDDPINADENYSRRRWDGLYVNDTRKKYPNMILVQTFQNVSFEKKLHNKVA